MDSFAMTRGHLVASETGADVSQDACRHKITIKKLFVSFNALKK